MTLTLTLAPQKSKGLGCTNGLGCPQCSAPLVDTLAGIIRSDNKTKDTHCTQCDYSSTYDITTLQLAKTY